MSTLTDRMLSANQDFEREVWPHLAPMLGGGPVMSNELAASDSSTFHLDVQSGIDWWQMIPGGGMRGIAARVQWGIPYKTFTIRRTLVTGNATEYAKRIRDIDEGNVYPSVTIQAYLDRRMGDCLATAACKTSELISKCTDASIRYNRDGSTFYVVGWDEFDTDHIHIYDATDGDAT